MSRRADPKRIYLARRAAHVAQLTDAGLSLPTADELVTAWEAYADSEGRQRGSATFWEGAAEWIAERRSDAGR